MPHHSDDLVTLHAGDCLDVLRTLPDESVHAVVTDPPYGLAEHKPERIAAALVAWTSGDRDHVPAGSGGFMNRQWDTFVPPPAVWDEVYRVLKPGGHLAAFAGSRTYDLMGMSIRLAGFEIRDGLQWIMGSGFPKGQNVEKSTGDPRWSGWNTALKPAVEPIVLARKPLSGTVAANVLAHGTGAMNIDSCRVAHNEPPGKPSHGMHGKRAGIMGATVERYRETTAASTSGRWPANVVLSHVWTAMYALRHDVPEQIAQTIRAYYGVDEAVREVRNALPGDALGRQRGEVGQSSGESDRDAAGEPLGRASGDRAEVPHAPGGTGVLAGGERCLAVPVGAVPPGWLRYFEYVGTSPACRPPECEESCPVAELDRQSEGTRAAKGSKGSTRGGGGQVYGGGNGYAGTLTEVGQALTGYEDGGSAARFFPVFEHDDVERDENGCAPGCPVAELDRQSGNRPGAASQRHIAHGVNEVYGKGLGAQVGEYQGYNDEGGASRFFPVAELDGAPFRYQAKAPSKERPKIDGKGWPTVKPLALMRWLVRLLTPPGGTVLEPFAGSGTTIEAAMLEGFRVIGIERDEFAYQLTCQRIERAHAALAEQAQAEAKTAAEPTTPPLFDVA